ncbi:hypothetical protein AVEN_260455-1 [Araneus ventricosus]|uniref:Uncharacterized protein n=1 Tax=Araneus ventricosus TaxID=182803 RepID=A0A4Y2KWV1_ARAVE|nr:hypothetical protein AVEN_260455-1 [Araneus ventricosus]
MFLKSFFKQKTPKQATGILNNASCQPFPLFKQILPPKCLCNNQPDQAKLNLLRCGGQTQAFYKILPSDLQFLFFLDQLPPVVAIFTLEEIVSHE